MGRSNADVHRVRLRPQGCEHYVVAVDRQPVAEAHFARFRTGEGMTAEAWVEWPDGRFAHIPTAYFADFVREVRRMFAPP